MAVLIKLGALAMQVDHARAFVAKIREVAGSCPIVLFPGGGGFADLIRKIDTEYHIGDEAAHWLAIHAMDSLGLLLAKTCPGVRPLTSLYNVVSYLEQPFPVLADGLPELPLWLPFAWLSRADPAPHSWEVTSDSLAVIAGARLGVEWVGLAKMTDHLTKNMAISGHPRLYATEVERMMVASKDGEHGEEWGVDAYLPQAIIASKIPCRIFDGRDIPNVDALLRNQGNPKYAEILP